MVDAGEDRRGKGDFTFSFANEVGKIYSSIGSVSSRRKAKLLLIEKQKKIAEERLEQQKSIDRKFFDAMWRELDSGNNSSGSDLSSKCENVDGKSKVNRWFETFQMHQRRQSKWSPGRDDTSLNNPLNSNAHLTIRNLSDNRKNNVSLRLPAANDLTSSHVRLKEFLDKPDHNSRNFNRTHEDRMKDNFDDDVNCNWSRHRLTDRQIAARHAQTQRSALPDFSGDPREWPVFISAYYYSTDDCGYSNQENLIRLQRCLRGQARVDVEGLLLSPDTVPDVLETLEIIYGSPETIIHQQLKELRARPIVRENDLVGLTRLALKVRNACAVIKACRLRAHLLNPELVQEIVEKLPSNLKLDWALHKLALDSQVNMISFSEWLYAIGTAAATVTRNVDPVLPKELRVKIPNKTKIRESVMIQSSTPNITRPVEQIRSYICKCCSGDHTIENCPTFAAMNTSDKWNFVKKNNRCRSCLGNHLHFRCRKQSRCGINGCDKKHHPLLHSERVEENKNLVLQSNLESGTVHQQTTMVCNNHQHECSVLFRIVPVTLYNGTNKVDTYAFMDEGSSVTLIEGHLANQLQLAGPRELLCLKWTGDISREEENSRRVNVEVSSRASNRRYSLKDVRTVSNLNLPTQSCNVAKLQLEYDHLKNIQLSSYCGAKPSILIGMNNWQMAVPLEVKEGRWRDPIAVKTRLGWIVCGPTSANMTSNYLNLHICSCERRDEELHQLVKGFFGLENFGTRPIIKLPQSVDEARASYILKNSVLFENGRYEAGILWRDDVESIPDSRSMAYSRMICLERKMRRNPDIAIFLREQIKAYQNKGYIKKLDKAELSLKLERVWYLPMFVIQHPFKLKSRIVWDASAGVNGVSLNSLTIPGTDVIPPLPNILFKFRENAVAICGDIREMYHQVRIGKDDKFALRFFWRDEETKALQEYAAEVWLFGINCAGTVAQHVLNTNAVKFNKQYPEATRAICEAHYRDDWLDSYPTEAETLKVAKSVRHVHAKGGFEMRNWLSNSKGVMSELGTDKYTGNELALISEATEKVLGMFWDPNNDNLRFVLNRKKIDIDNLMTSPPTKRMMLRVVMLVFDPLGLVSYVMILGKLLIQSVWRKAIGWDECIDDELFEKWRLWMKMLLQIEDIRIPRCYQSLNHVSSVEMHTFVDASESAYSAVIYFRFISEDQCQVSLITSKTRVAPNKPLSVPRLELLAGVLGARLASNVSKAHRIKIDRRFYWSDSRTVLSWIGSDAKKYHQFVALRVGELLELTDVSEWRWVPTKLNIADIATKWREDNSTSIMNCWFEGPHFIRTSIADFPNFESGFIDNHAESELRTHGAHMQINIYEPVIPSVENFSCWIRVWRIQACVLRVANNWFAKGRKNILINGPYSFEEMKKAEIMLFKGAQWDIWKEDVIKLSRGIAVESKSPLFIYCPYLDEFGVVRCRGRISNAEVEEDVKNKIVLPSNL